MRCVLRAVEQLWRIRCGRWSGAGAEQQRCDHCAGGGCRRRLPLLAAVRLVVCALQARAMLRASLCGWSRVCVHACVVWSLKVAIA
jgi:hypothetical protein